MPTLLRIGPYRFFYANDCKEPPQVHVECDRAEAKFWLAPAHLAWSRGFRPHDVNQIESIVVEHEREWGEIGDEYFNT